MSPPETKIIFVSGGDFWGRHRGGREGRANPRTTENFRNLSKVFIRILLKWIILAYFQNKYTNYALIFHDLGEKHKLLGNFEEKLENFLRKFNRKIEFLIIFQNFLKNIALGNAIFL